jgi:hypothetical protein
MGMCPVLVGTNVPDMPAQNIWLIFSFRENSTERI